MVKNAIIAIDDDQNFLDRLQVILNDLGVLNDQKYFGILARGQTSPDVIAHCIQKIHNILATDFTITLVLLDIVIIEHSEESPKDRSGLEIAKRLHSYPQDFPIVGMTRYIKSHRLVSEVSLDRYIQGILLKPFIEDVEFTRKVFLEIVAKAKSKTRIRQTPAPSPPLPTKPLEGRFTLQDDPRLEFEVQKIGVPEFMGLMENLFPLGQGTLKYLRPGLSGSYVFKTAVKTTSKGFSPTQTRKWLVKIADNEVKLDQELQRCIELRSRVAHHVYPQLFKETLVPYGPWFAIAFELQEDAVTFEEYFRRKPAVKKMSRLVSDLVVPFLKEHYGDPVKHQCFVWKTFYSLEKRSQAGVLAFLTDARLLIPRRLSSADGAVLKRIANFVTGTSEPAIYEVDADCDTRLLHGDFHSRNILVADDGSKVVFIDFANSAQGHYMKDIAKLETDAIFRLMDINDSNQTDWSRLTTWNSIFSLYQKNKLFSPAAVAGGDIEVKRVVGLITALRQGLRSLNDEPDESQYLLALLHFSLKILTYQDVTIQKKVLAIRLIDIILKLMSPDRS